MNIDLVIDNYLDTLLDDVVKKIDGIEKIVPCEEKVDLGICFGQSLNLKVNPFEFESNISKTSVKIKAPDGTLFEWGHSLNEKQILHFILLYHLCYLKAYYPNKYDKIQDIPSSNDLNEIFSKTKEEIYGIYIKVKDNASN